MKINLKKFKPLNKSNLFNKFFSLNTDNFGNSSSFIFKQQTKTNPIALVIKREYAKDNKKQEKKDTSKKQTKKDMMKKMKEKEQGSDEEGREDDKSIEILEKMVGWTPRVDTRTPKQKEYDSKKVEEWRVLLRTQHNNMLRKEYRKWRMMRSGKRKLNIFIL